MKTKIYLWMLPAAIACMTLLDFSSKGHNSPQAERLSDPEDGCVFMTLMGEQSSLGFDTFKTSDNLKVSVNDGLLWLSKAQLPDGGYGAGSHNAQHVRNPHAVPSDPATTAMAGMAFLRSGTTFTKGPYAGTFRSLTAYLLEAVENTPDNHPYITEVRGTQIQSKLGENIDAILVAQFLSNLMERNLKGIDKNRLARSLDICIAKIEQGTDANGRQIGAGWAGVLQSGLASSALESARAVGATVGEEVLLRARSYQKDNYDEKTGNVKTEDGAGIMLYAVSGSVRATARDARKVTTALNNAKEQGKLGKDAQVTAANLKKAGFSEEEAIAYTTSYKVYEASKQTAQQADVMEGFGNNGGEEFLSFLQTGESLAVNQDKEWKKWYDAMSGRILKIQNPDGSWNGHHCITSPVFCTATSIMLLTIENDLEYLNKIGQ